MFDPDSLLTTASPLAPSATTSNRVVVVFPLVPVTSATSRPALRCSSRRGSTRSPARPPATVPWPRPSRRDAALTARVVALASPVLTEGASCAPAPRGWARGEPATPAATARSMASMIVSVSFRALLSDSATGLPSRTDTVGGLHTSLTSGVRDERGHTFSVPHRPTGTTVAPVEAARRAVPVLPRRTGSKKSYPRGIVPCGSTMTMSPAFRADSASRSGWSDPLPRSTEIPPMARAIGPTTGASKISFLPRKRTGRPTPRATRASAATSK